MLADAVLYHKLFWNLVDFWPNFFGFEFEALFIPVQIRFQKCLTQYIFQIRNGPGGSSQLLREKRCSNTSAKKKTAQETMWGLQGSMFRKHLVRQGWGIRITSSWSPILTGLPSGSRRFFRIGDGSTYLWWGPRVIQFGTSWSLHDHRCTQERISGEEWAAQG